MSKWFELELKDISCSVDDDTVQMLVTSDYDGNIYATLTFEQMEKIHDRLEEIKELSKTKSLEEIKDFLLKKDRD